MLISDIIFYEFVVLFKKNKEKKTNFLSHKKQQKHVHTYEPACMKSETRFAMFLSRTPI